MVYKMQFSQFLHFNANIVCSRQTVSLNEALGFINKKELIDAIV